MRISVTCPFCGKKGSLPDAMRGQRVKCANCHQPFVVGGTTKPAAQPAAGLLAALLDDDEARSEVRPLPLASTRRSVQPEPSGSPSPAVYVGIGIGGFCLSCSQS